MVKNSLIESNRLTRNILLGWHFSENNSTNIKPVIPKIDFCPNPWTPSGPDTFYSLIEDYRRQSHENIKQHFRTLRHQPSKMQQLITETYESFLQDNDTIIRPADKNMGLCTISPEYHQCLIQQILADTDTYEEIPSARYNANKIYAQLRAIMCKYNKLFLRVQNKKRLSKLANSLLQLQNSKYLRIPIFYILPKMHKNPVKGRPIVSSINSITYHTSKYLDALFQPVRRLLPGICFRSSDIIQDMETFHCPPNAVIVTADVVSLYPNIPVEYGLYAVKHILEQYHSNPTVSFTEQDCPFLLELLHWVLKNNYFQQESNIYHQKQGTAMGTPIAVAYADMTLSFLEQECLQLTNVYYYKRYIDDLFIITDEATAPILLNIFQSKCHSIKLDDIKIGSDGIFLDIALRIQDNRIITSIYQKALNTHSYIPPTSSHKVKVFSNFIRSELRRYRLLCTLDTDFQNISAEFYLRLLNRGYKATFIRKHFYGTPSRRYLLLQLTRPARQQNPNNILLFRPPHTDPKYKIPWHEMLKIPDMIKKDRRFRLAFQNNARILVNAKHPPAAYCYLVKHNLTYRPGWTNSDGKHSSPNPIANQDTNPNPSQNALQFRPSHNQN